MPALRLIIDPPNTGAWNMAADEYLLRSADDDDQWTLRFYSWKTPTLSLGYFQRHIDRAQHTTSARCDVVRRSSGGGAILHHHEITYSLTLPIRDRWSKKAEDLYFAVHGIVIKLLQDFGVQCELYDGKPQNSAFLCFQRRAVGDVTLNRSKVMGSAQRRTKQGLLQHGSLMFRSSEHAPELPGIAEKSGFTLANGEFIKNWSKQMADCFSSDIREDMFATEESHEIKSLASEKYDQDTWNYRR